MQSRSDDFISCLEELSIPYLHLQPDSGLFLWIDFHKFLPELSVNESIALKISYSADDI